MICTVEVEFNAAHPELPLNEASTFVGSPSAVFVKKVPRSVGNWKLTKVYVSFAYPDNSLVTAEAVATGGVWVATLSACDTSGRTLNGFQISADGIDENGNAVEGYVLGIGDLSVCNRDRTVAPGVTAYNLRYFDTAPTSPKKGDVAPNANGDQLYYNGSSWVPFANVANKADLVDGKVPSSQLPSYVDDVLEFASRSAFPATGESGKIYVAIDTNKTYRWSGTQYTEIANPDLDDAVTKNSSNGVKSSGIWTAIWGALAALPTGFASLYDWVVSKLAGKLASISAAPAWVSGTAYTTNALVTYNGVVYRCKANTVSPHTATPEADATHWEVKPVSELFLRAAHLVTEILPESHQFADVPGVVVFNPNGVSYLSRLGETQLRQLLQNGGVIDAFGNAICFPARSETSNEVYDLATAVGSGHNGNLAALDSRGNPTDSQIPKADVALKSAIPYNLVTKTISNNAVTLDDRASNAVDISATLSPNTLTVNFPAATSGKVRDFALRLNIASGVTAPELVLPQGVVCENADGEVPEILDGGTGGSSTILYFSETESNGTTAKFLLKGETLAAITQA